jgi:hypothetical protein
MGSKAAERMQFSTPKVHSASVGQVVDLSGRALSTGQRDNLMTDVATVWRRSMTRPDNGRSNARCCRRR